MSHASFDMSRFRCAVVGGILALGGGYAHAGSVYNLTSEAIGPDGLTGTSTTLSGEVVLGFGSDVAAFVDCTGSVGCGLEYSFDIASETGTFSLSDNTGATVGSGTFDQFYFVAVAGITGSIVASVTPGSGPWVDGLNFESGAFFLDYFDPQGGAGLGLDFDAFVTDVDFTVTTVPLPAAAWLFGSALGLLGVFGGARRRNNQHQVA